LLAEPAADTVSTVKQDPLQTVVHAGSAGPGWPAHRCTRRDGRRAPPG